MYTHIYMSIYIAESLCCTAEANTALQTSYTSGEKIRLQTASIVVKSLHIPMDFLDIVYIYICLYVKL